jgi:hypothetical protein
MKLINTSEYRSNGIDYQLKVFLYEGGYQVKIFIDDIQIGNTYKSTIETSSIFVHPNPSGPSWQALVEKIQTEIDSDLGIIFGFTIDVGSTTLVLTIADGKSIILPNDSIRILQGIRTSGMFFTRLEDILRNSNPNIALDMINFFAPYFKKPNSSRAIMNLFQNLHL